MDVKSLARSKRAHSQHQTKKHNSKPTTVIAPTVASGGASVDNKPSGKRTGDKPHQSQSSKRTLPTNRDRYEEDYDSDLNDQSNNSINPEIDGFVPKSKGADYKYLLSEAKLQSEANISSDTFPSFDDVLSDFREGFGSLLSVRRESILSWARYDNFIVEDKAATTCESSFLSLNLNLLAEQLEKVDLPRRLLIEPDFFLAELSSDHSKIADEEYDKAQVAIWSQERRISSDELIDDHLGKEDNLKGEDTDVDALLNSISITKFLNSSDLRLNNDTQLGHQKETLFKMESSSSIFNKVPVLHPQRDSQVPTDFDDDLDDLLKETCSLSFSWKISSVSRTKNCDDDLDELLVEETSSNIKSVSVMSNIDDELDDLLKETSTEKIMSQSHGVDLSQS